MYSPAYSTGMYLPLQQIASALVSGTPTTPASSPVLTGYYAAPYPVPAALSGSTSPALYGVGNPNDLHAVLMENTPTQLRKLFIGGLNHETDDLELREYYEKFGTVVDSIVIKDPNTRHSRGFGFVTFATMEMADIAMAARPHVITGKTVDAKRAIARDQMMQLQNSVSPPTFLIAEPAAGCKLAINDVDVTSTTIDDLRTYFECFGPVEQVEVIGQPRGHGFVVFESRHDAELCLQYGPYHAINDVSLIEVRDFSELYGYNVHYAPNGGLPSYYRNDRSPQQNALRSSGSSSSSGCPSGQAHPGGIMSQSGHHNGHHRHHRHDQFSSLSVNCSLESTSASELGNYSPHNGSSKGVNDSSLLLSPNCETDDFASSSPTSVDGDEPANESDGSSSKTAADKLTASGTPASSKFTDKSNGKLVAGRPATMSLRSRPAEATPRVQSSHQKLRRKSRRSGPSESRPNDSFMCV